MAFPLCSFCCFYGTGINIGSAAVTADTSVNVRGAAVTANIWRGDREQVVLLESWA